MHIVGGGAGLEVVGAAFVANCQVLHLSKLIDQKDCTGCTVYVLLEMEGGIVLRVAALQSSRIYCPVGNNFLLFELLITPTWSVQAGLLLNTSLNITC